MNKDEIDDFLDKPEVIERIKQRAENKHIQQIENKFVKLLRGSEEAYFEGIPLIRFSAQCLVGMIIYIHTNPNGGALGLPLKWGKGENA